MNTSRINFARLMVVGLLTLGIMTVGRSQPRLQTGFRNGIDSLRPKGMPHQVLDEMQKHNGHHTVPSPLRRMVSPQSQYYVIDTAIVLSTTDTTRHRYSFNANGKMTSDYTQKYGGDLWVDVKRETYTYDAANRMLTHLFETSSDSQWVLTGRERWLYDAAGNTLSDSLEHLGLDGQWRLSYRSTSTYDVDGNRLTYVWEGIRRGYGKMFWWELEQYTYTYDAEGKRLSEECFVSRDAEWGVYHHHQYIYGYDVYGRMVLQLRVIQRGGSESTYLCTYTYDAMGRKVSELGESWSSGQWVNSDRYTYTFDANGNMLTNLHEVWNGQWVFSDCRTYTYDASNNMLSELSESLVDGQRVNRWSWTYTYDPHGNRLSEVLELWRNDQWENDQRFVYAYDAEDNLTSFFFYYWRDSNWTQTVDYPIGSMGSLPPPYSVEDSAGNLYALGYGYSFTLIRKLIVTGVAFQNGNVPEVYCLSQNYPNPFNPSTTIRYELPRSSMVRLGVYDLLGREVSVLVNERRSAGAHEVKFDGSNLASGVYFYRLTAGDLVQSKKLVLVK